MIKTILFTLFLPLMGFCNSLVFNKKDNKAFFGKDYTTVLKGLCCLIVIYVHVPAAYRNPLQDAIGSFAYVSVTLFFLVSAYGMMLSAERKGDYLKHFWKNRLVALLVPCLMVNIVALCMKAASTGEWVYAILNSINYYVVILLQWCVWFYIVMLCRKKWFADNIVLTDGLLIGGVLLSSLYSYFFIEAEFSANSGWPFERMGLIWGVYSIGTLTSLKNGWTERDGLKLLFWL